MTNKYILESIDNLAIVLESFQKLNSFVLLGLTVTHPFCTTTHTLFDGCVVLSAVPAGHTTESWDRYVFHIGSPMNMKPRPPAARTNLPLQASALFFIRTVNYDFFMYFFL